MTTATLPDVSVQDAAAMARVSEYTIRRWMKSGLLKAVKVGGTYRTTREWIEEIASPVSPMTDTSNGRLKDDDNGYDSAILNLRVKFGIGSSKVSRP